MSQTCRDKFRITQDRTQGRIGEIRQKAKKGQAELTEIGFDRPFPSTNAISSWSLISLVIFTSVERLPERGTSYVHEPSIGLCAERSGARQLGIKEASHARVGRRERRHQMHLTLARAPGNAVRPGMEVLYHQGMMPVWKTSPKTVR
jgi:hypothetical protein